jgi:hypothetical protein
MRRTSVSSNGESGGINGGVFNSMFTPCTTTVRPY